MWEDDSIDGDRYKPKPDIYGIRSMIGGFLFLALLGLILIPLLNN